MRWKWKLGSVLVVAAEIPLIWAGLTFRLPADLLAYLVGILTVVLLAMLALRPALFAMAGFWLFGVAGSGWYFLRYVPPGLAFGLGAVLSTVACSVAPPIYLRVFRSLFRRFF